ncbi:hypothetical protein B9Z19DRAFT_1136378 [Tuber borchii]|uniref:Uncharacterized protein n=1 Tax=Tuber borchii TaxID=42251 RepID=A0A2T6ZBQ7_TUBBO|nr:hypothetical protein B9Z19DRAFT_1136378 [Tuber borchii]
MFRKTPELVPAGGQTTGGIGPSEGGEGRGDGGPSHERSGAGSPVRRSVSPQKRLYDESEVDPKGKKKQRSEVICEDNHAHSSGEDDYFVCLVPTTSSSCLAKVATFKGLKSHIRSTHLESLTCPIGECEFVTHNSKDLYKHHMDDHHGDTFQGAVFRTLNHSRYEDKEALKSAKNMDQIFEIFSRQEGEIPAAGPSGQSGSVGAGSDGGDEGEVHGVDPAEQYGRDYGVGDEGDHGVGNGESEEEGDGDGEGDGEEQVPWGAAEGFMASHFADFAQTCTEDLRRQYGTAPRSPAEMEEIFQDLGRFFSAIALAARDNI